jgi:hypothetical protein
MAESDWQDFPSATQLMLMLFADDDTNDHRIGIDQIFTPFVGNKHYRILVSTNHGACSMAADHIVPMIDGTLPLAVNFNALDTWGTMRYASALAACTLRTSADACAIVNGTAAQALHMGTFNDDASDVPRMIASDAPMPVHPSRSYTFPVGGSGLNACAR